MNYDVKNFDFVDGLVADLDRIADRMEAVGFGKDYKSGHVTVLREIAADARREVREEEHIPTSVRFDRLTAFSAIGINAAATNSRTDLPSRITRLFAAAKMPVPPLNAPMSLRMTDLVLKESGLNAVERMAMKSEFERIGLADFTKVEP